MTDIEDIDYQKSRTELSARWYGFEHAYTTIQYTACLTEDNGSILIGTCTFVGTESRITFEGLTLTAFKVIFINKTNMMRQFAIILYVVHFSSTSNH